MTTEGNLTVCRQSDGVVVFFYLFVFQKNLTILKHLGMFSPPPPAADTLYDIVYTFIHHPHPRLAPAARACLALAALHT